MKPESQRVVTRDEYIAYFLVAYGVLMPEEDVDVSVKMVAIEADWEDDSKGEDTLTHDTFTAALFELVGAYACMPACVCVRASVSYAVVVLFVFVFVFVGVQTIGVRVSVRLNT